MSKKSYLLMFLMAALVGKSYKSYCCKQAGHHCNNMKSKAKPEPISRWEDEGGNMS